MLQFLELTLNTFHPLRCFMTPEGMDFHEIELGIVCIFGIYLYTFFFFVFLASRPSLTEAG